MLQEIGLLEFQRFESVYWELLLISDRHLLYSIFQSSSFSGTCVKHKADAGRFLVRTLKSISSRTKMLFSDLTSLILGWNWTGETLNSQYDINNIKLSKLDQRSTKPFSTQRCGLALCFRLTWLFVVLAYLVKSESMA